MNILILKEGSMKNLNTKYIVLLISLITLSCEDVFFDNDPVNSSVNNFEILWNRMDERYSFFEYKGVDWDSIYTIYRPQVNDQMSPEELFDVMEKMLNTLRDGHVNLRTDFDISYYNYHDDAPRNFRFQDVENNYLKESLRVTGFTWNGIIDSVGYIHYRSFQRPIEEEELDFVVKRFKGLKGLIIDIRDNEGGDPAYGFRLARRIAKERTYIYSTKYKNGPGRDDFTSPSDAFLDINDKIKFDLPVVLLTNRVTYSAGNFFTALMMALPDVTVVGDTTGGGGGVPLGWELPNGWHFNFSNSITYMPNGFIIENGIPPDIPLNINDEDRLEGRDTILEKAIDLLR